jgi:flagella synthesis protein FlgN
LNNTLLAHLRAETQAFGQFYETLQAEQKALVGNDVTALTAISQTKQKQVETLSRLASERQRHLAAMGFNANEDGMMKWLSTTGEDERKVWNDLLVIAREANTCNQINGKLILQGMQHHQQALAILLAAANQVSLYGADGQPQGMYSGSGASRGIIGSA